MRLILISVEFILSVSLEEVSSLRTELILASEFSTVSDSHIVKRLIISTLRDVLSSFANSDSVNNTAIDSVFSLRWSVLS